MKIGKSLQKFDSIIYEGVITPFHLEYYIKKSLWEQLLLCKWEFLKTMHGYLLPFPDSHFSLEGVFPLLNRLFQQNVCKHKKWELQIICFKRWKTVRGEIFGFCFKIDLKYGMGVLLVKSNLDVIMNTSLTSV